MKSMFRMLTWVSVLCYSCAATAFNMHKATGEKAGGKPRNTLDFIENKGQWNAEARFKALLPGGAVFLTDDGFVYHFAGQVHDPGKQDTGGRQKLMGHAYKVNFLGHTNSIRYTQADQRAYYHNYYIGNDPASWAGHVPIAGKIIAHNVYPGIDVAVYSNANNIKYDFLVAAGAHAAQIRLRYDGVSPQLTPDGRLKIRTAVNEVIEQKPYSYQLRNGKQEEVACRFRLEGQVLTFEFPGGYDTSRSLIIDPELIYSTFSGASYIPTPSTLPFSGDHARVSAFDKDGRHYVAATVTGLGWPVTLGAYDMTWDTRSDVGILVYNPNGTSIEYATYYGAESEDIPLTMVVNDNNEVIVAGSTRSASLPMSVNAYDATFAGGNSDAVYGNDIFVAHFNNTGTQLLGATYLGGSGYEACPIAVTMLNQPAPANIAAQNTITPLEMTLDNAGNIWMISNTTSTNFPVTAGAQQTAFAGGYNDMVLCKLNPGCSQLLYSSYLGGSGADVGSAITFNNSGNLVICGATNSGNFPVSSGAFLTVAPGGTYDGFVSVINPATGSIVRSTYLGTNLADHAAMLQVDENDNVYIAGRTYGNYPISANVFSLPGGDVFLQKLNAQLSVSMLSTRLGNPQTGSNRGIPTGFMLSSCNEIVYSNFSHIGIASILPVTANAIDPIPKRFWFCKMPADFSGLNYASYFGSVNGSDYRYCGSWHYDPKGIIYQSLSTSTTSGFPTTPGAWSPASQIGTPQASVDVVSFKIGFQLEADFELDPAVGGNDSGCAPYTVQMINTSSGANSYIWDFDDGSPLSTMETPPPHTFVNPGVYLVKLYAYNDTACSGADTAFMTITVLDAVQPDISVQDTLLCTPAQTIEIAVQINNPNPAFSIQWTPPGGILSPADQAVITVSPNVNSEYYVTVTNDLSGICSLSATDTLSINVQPGQVALITQDTAVCEGQTIQITAQGNPEYNYQWIPGTGMNDSTVLEPSISVTQSEQYTLLASYPGCPDTALFLTVDMQHTPVVTVGPDKQVCAGVDVALESMVSPYRNDYIYMWLPTTNLSTPNGPNAHFIADTTTHFILTVQTPIGCSGSDSITILVFPSVTGGITPDTGYCPGSVLQLQATGGTVYTWSPAYGLSDSTVSDPVAQPGTSTLYTVVIANAYHCTDTQTVNVEVYSGAVINMPDSVNVYPGEPYYLEPGTNCHYFSWFPPSGIDDTHTATPTFYPEVRTRYFVTAVTEHGCEVKDSIDVLVKETVIDMPNAFNASGNNRLFKPSKRGIAQLRSFSIFNRWGNKVYSSTNIEEGWDGSYNGQPQPIGVYVYVIEAVTDKGTVFTKQGNVTLIR